MEISYKLKKKLKIRLGLTGLVLPCEDQVSGEHAGDAGDLLLLMHPVVVRNIGLKVECDLSRHSEQ